MVQVLVFSYKSNGHSFWSLSSLYFPSEGRNYVVIGGYFRHLLRMGDDQADQGRWINAGAQWVKNRSEVCEQSRVERCYLQVGVIHDWVVLLGQLVIFVFLFSPPQS